MKPKAIVTIPGGHEDPLSVHIERKVASKMSTPTQAIYYYSTFSEVAATYSMVHLPRRLMANGIPLRWFVLEADSVVVAAT